MLSSQLKKNAFSMKLRKPEVPGMLFFSKTQSDAYVVVSTIPDCCNVIALKISRDSGSVRLIHRIFLHEYFVSLRP